MRIVHVIAPSPMGGAESVVRALAGVQTKRGHNVHVLALLDADGDQPRMVRSLTEDGVSVRIVRETRSYWRQVGAIRSFMHEDSINLMHCHGYRGIVLGFLATGGLKVARVATVHGYTGGGLKNRFFEWLDKRCLRRFDGVIAVSTRLKDELLAVGVSQPLLHCVPNGCLSVDVLDRAEAYLELGLDTSMPVIGWLGRLSHEKGGDLFLDALSEVLDRPWLAVVVGDGPERENLEAQAHRLSLSERVRFLGNVPDAARLANAFDLFVLSSRTEGLPIALLEMMFAGVPAVATPVGEVPEVLRGGGTLAKSVSASQLAVAIRCSLTNLEAAATRAESARTTVMEKYGVEKWIERIETVYQIALSERKGSCPRKR